ncbi:hypothetical protein [Aristophania vespae]|uniref:hypothetical protein n=1 Tax=Aristophania vespae TaxID=2697033 RepID=UPI002351844E|nr:hypothetical protein [Aristophania vespae]UMM64032.1 hypothetical protein DM15PD_10130 [Aristophania vespae]
MKPYLFEHHILPSEFNFPSDYLDVVLNNKIIDIKPWNLLSNNMFRSIYNYSFMLLTFPKATLVPFALIRYQAGPYNNEWSVVAYFDNENAKNDPIIRVHDSAKPKSTLWNNPTYSSFSEWLKTAKQQASTMIQDKPQVKIISDL